jgi:hypothetical protein
MFLTLGGDDDDAAVLSLTNHFTTVIDLLLAGNWRHYSKPARRRTGDPTVSKSNAFSRDQCQKSLIFDANPCSFFLQPNLIRDAISDVRHLFIKSLQNFKFQQYNAHIEACLGADFLGVGDSGIDQLFPRRRRGRPRHGDEKKEISLKVCCPFFLMLHLGTTFRQFLYTIFQSCH